MASTLKRKHKWSQIITQLVLALLVFSNFHVFSQSSQLTLQTGHSDDIVSLAFSSDGKFLASAGKDNVIIVWDFTLGKEIRRLKGHTNQVNVINFLSSNNLISSGNDGKIITWDISEGRSIRVIDNKASVQSFDVSPNHNFLAVAGYSSLKIWNLSDTSITPVLIEKQICSSVSFHTNGYELIYSISNKKEKGIYIYNLNTKETNKLNKVRASNCTFDGSGKFAITTYLKSSKIRVDDLTNNNPLYVRPGDYSRFKFITIVHNPNDSIFAAGNYDNSIYIFEKNSGKRKLVIREFKLPPLAVQFHPIKKEIIVFSAGRAIIVWNIIENKLVRKIESSVYPISAADINSDGKLIALAGIDNSIKVYDLNNNVKINFFEGHQANITSLKFISSYDTIATVGLDNKLHYWLLNDSTQKKAIKVIKNPMVLVDKTISAAIPLSIGGNMLTMFLLGRSFFMKNYELLNTLSISKDKKYLATGGGGWRGISSIAFPRSFPIYIYNNTTQKREFKLYGHYYKIKSLAFNASGKLLASCAKNDQYLKIWNLETRKLKTVYSNSNYNIQAVEFSPINDTLAFTDWTNVYLFDTKTDSAKLLSGGRAPILFHKNGQSVFFQDNNYNIVQYDFINKLVKNIFIGHNDIVSSISLVDDCSRMVTSSWDGTIKLWDIIKGKEIVTFIALNNTDYILKTPDNFYLATKKAKKEIGFSSGLKFYPFEQYDLQFNRPDIILARLGIASEELVNAYYQAYNKRLKKMGFSENMFENDFHLPDISIIDIDKLPLNTTSSKLSFKISASDSKYNLNRISVWVNNVPVFGINGINLRPFQINTYEKDISIDLSQGINKIQVSCLNEKGVESLKESFEITYQPKQFIKPDLYLIAIGASEYKDKEWDLTYASKDANDFSELFYLQKEHYKNIFTTKLINQEVTIDNIRNIEHKLQSTHVDDVVIIFYAGHGLLDDSLDYYLATYNIDFNKPGINGLKYEDLDVLLDSIPARNKVLFIDACHSGEVDKESHQELITENIVEKDVVFRGVKSRGNSTKSGIGFSNSFELMKELFSDIRKGTGAVVVSSAGGGEFAFEGENWKNGVFTYSMLNGINSFLADKNKDKKITLSELQDFMMKQVQKLTNGKQKPTVRQENIDNDFVIWEK